MKRTFLLPKIRNACPLSPFCERRAQTGRKRRDVRLPLLSQESVRSTATLVQDLRRDFQYLPAAESGETG